MDLTTVTPAPEVLFRDLSGEGVLLNLKSGCYYGLDAVGTRVWQMLMQGRTLACTVEQLLSEYEVSRDQLEADVACFIEALEAHGLVVRTPGRSGGDPAPR